MRSPRSRAFVGVCLTLPPLACARPTRPPEPPRAPCGAAPAQAPPGMSLRGASGDYRVRLVATAARWAGGAADGDLLLEDADTPWFARPDTTRHPHEFRVATWGVLTIRLGAVAPRVYGMRSRGEVAEHFLLRSQERRPRRGPAAGGVHWLFARPPLAEEADLLNSVRSLVLRVTAHDGDRLAGRWTAAAPDEDGSGGYWCAARVRARLP